MMQTRNKLDSLVKRTGNQIRNYTRPTVSNAFR